MQRSSYRGFHSPAVSLVVGGCALIAVCSTLSAAANPTVLTGGARFATFNASLNRATEGQLIIDLSTPDNQQAKTVAEIIQRANPDILLINEFDYDAKGIAAELFQAHYLSVSQQGATPIEYPYYYVAEANTGIPSGFDLDNNGSVGGPGDALGFGFFPGQFGMAVYSKFPILEDQIRTFQKFLWKDMPEAILPDDPATDEPADWYSKEELAIFRLSSKSHWDIPININGRTVHLLASHPTPPVFDGPEDRNGTRNHDEIRLWADYVTPGAGEYIYDDSSVFGGLEPGESFVIVGDQNADPFDGDSLDEAVLQLLDHPGINVSLAPISLGGIEATLLQGGINLYHIANPAFDTADFSDTTPGNLRADYVLPSIDLPLANARIFWPTSSDPLYALTGDGSFPNPSSDHRLVWADVPLLIDLDEDGDIDGEDLAILLGLWGPCVPAAEKSCPGDFDSNGIINGIDLAVLLAAWT